MGPDKTVLLEGAGRVLASTVPVVAASKVLQGLQPMDDLTFKVCTLSMRRAAMRPSTALELKRTLVREAAGRYRTANPRVFGSALRGTDQEGSDLDLLVDALPDAALFDLGGLQSELEVLLGVRVDLLTPADLPARIRAQVLAEARPV